MTLKRITVLMMVLIIMRGGLVSRFQFVFGVDEEAAESDDLVSVLQPVLNRRVELSLDARLDFLRDVLAAFTLDVDDVLCLPLR